MGRIRGSAVFGALAVAMAAALAGCGGGSGNSASVASTTSSAATASSSAASTQSSTTGAPSQTSTTSTTTTTTSASSTSGAAKPTIGMIPLTSPAFAKGSKIPTRYTCDGANETPPVQWAKVPAGTSELLLFVLDLAGGQKGGVRWAVGNISPNTHSIAANSIPPGAVLGRNSLGKTNWAGICPAKGRPHSYVFLLYALRHKLSLSSGFDTSTLQRQLKGNTVAAGLMFGTYQRA